MDSNDYKSLVLYYGRLRFYNSMQKTALDGLAKFPTQSEFRLFNGIALALGNKMQECIRELNPLKNEVELGLAATMTLMYAHKHCRLIDTDAVQALEHRTVDGNKAISAVSFYYTAVFLYLIGDLDASLDYIGRSLKINPNCDVTMVLKGWCALSLSTDESTNGKLHNILTECITRGNGKNFDASLALVRFYQKRHQFEAALLIINKLSIRFSDISIPLVEKMETQLAALDWDYSLDTANRVINMEPFHVVALRTKAMLNIVRESNFKSGTATLQQLLISVERTEPGNHRLFVEICQLFSRICSRNFELLQMTVRCIEKVNELHSGNVSLLTELGYQKLLLDNVVDAELAFRSACNVDSNNFNALCGLTLCKLKCPADSESRLQIKQQLACLIKLTDYKPEPMVLYISALFGDLKEQQSSSVQLLVEAAELHFKKFELMPFGVEYVRTMNPDFMLEMCVELIRHSPATIRESYYDFDLGQKALHITLKHSLNILEIVLHVCPGHQRALFMRAKVEFLCGEHTKAINRLQHILNLCEETFVEAHLLLAQILVEKKEYSKALEYLDLSLAQKFTVREQPMYHLLKGIVLKHQQKLSEAHQSFLSALQLVGGISTGPLLHDYITRTDNIFSSSDKITLYIELICVLREIGDIQGIYESERILQTAIEEFTDTTEIGRLVIAHSQLMLEKCKISEAVCLLSKIMPHQSYYIQARTHLANIFLKYHKNRSAFAQCFKELVEVRPEPKSYLMLAEAYQSIQETDMAIDAFRKACSICAPNAFLARKLGRAYVKCHHYAKALKYYHEVIQNPECSSLKLDLAELFLQLKQYQNAVNILAKGYDETNDNSITDLQLQTKQLLLLSRVYEKSGNIPDSLKALQNARENQYRVYKLCSISHSESLYEQSKLLSKICMLIAQQAIKLKSTELAFNYFKECIKYTPNDLEILVTLAQLQMESKNLDMCRTTCLQILQIDGNNESASVLMADLSFKKMDFKNAAYHFSQLLISQPCNWTALARLIEVMRRSGTLFETVPFIERAEQASSLSKKSSGLAYCKGLFDWYNGNFNCALRNFNLARRDHVWGQQAKLNMIEICINPDDEIPNPNDIFDVGESGEISESRLIALRTAERLIKEMNPRPGEFYENILSRRILWNLLQMASKQKLQVELALKDLTEILQKEGNSLMVGVVYAIALALVQLKQIQRAKNQLKRIARISWNYEDAEYLERSWLLLADIYIQGNKLDVAETYVVRVLEYNKSSTKAYELAGYIAEKSQSYSDAANQYQRAWECSGRSKPHIGYKLALNNMKKKQFANAVNVCQHVLKLHPDYTIIRKDILEKCRNNLRA